MSGAAPSRLNTLLGGWNPYDPARLADKGAGIEPVALGDDGARRSLVVAVVLAFLAFMVWAVMAPLDAGVVISGTVVVAGNRQAVQHAGGGVVQEILVKEGDTVEKGDLLLRVNPLSSEANLTSAELQYINLLATESRLLADRSAVDIRWRPELAQFGNADPRVVEAKQLQAQLLRSRRSELDSQTRILREQLAGLQAQARGQVNVAVEKRSQLKLISEEARNTRQLAKEGYVPEARANEVMRSQSVLQGDLANLQSEAARLQTSIAATELQVAQLRMAYNKDIDNQLSEAQKNRGAFESRMNSLKFDLNLAEVRAPVGGTLVAMKVNTVGGVVTAGQVLMEIVPADAGLVIEAQVPPASIDKVRVGLAADLRFSAFNQNTTPVVPGRIILVGADRLPATPTSGGEFYLAQVETTAAGLALLGANRIQPGMPVEVIVKTGERSFMAYLLKPLSDRFARSFKEN
jgi:protease secretion system membrane fusion protein